MHVDCADDDLGKYVVGSSMSMDLLTGHVRTQLYIHIG